MKATATPLKRTRLREKLLGLFDREKTLTLGELQEKMSRGSSPVDRVSLYRNLQVFLERGLIHRVGPSAYSKCRHQCSHHGHIILSCQECGKNEEVSDHPWVSQLTRDLGKTRFFADKSPLWIQGLCRSCSSPLSEN